MKTLITLLLMLLSSLAVADGYYGNPYQGGYAPYQYGYNGYNQAQIEQRSIDTARERQFQLEQDVERYNQMRRDYQDRRDTERFASFSK